MKRFLIICEETCTSCLGEKKGCRTCQGRGVTRTEVPLHEVLKTLSSKRRKSAFGMKGVTLGKTVRGNRISSFAWTAQLRVDGKYKNKSWAIMTHGYKGAYEQAAAERASNTGQPIKRCPKPTEELILWAKERHLKL